MKEEVEAVDIGIEDLSFERGVRCTTNNEEVKTLCRVLGLAQQWRISLWLDLPREMSVESWFELSKVIGKGTVDKFFDVHCKTDEEVKAACTVLGLLKRWNIRGLYLPEKMGAEGWSALTKEVARGGEVNVVSVNKLALRATSEQQARVLWRGTSWWWCEDGSDRIIAKKSDGEAGLGKLLAFKDSNDSSDNDSDIDSDSNRSDISDMLALYGH